MSHTGELDGLVHALQLDGEGGCKPYPLDNVSEWVPGEGTLWLHFNFEASSTRRWLEEFSGLNDIAVNALLSEETRPRTLTRGNYLLLALRGINLSPGNDPQDMISLRIWTDGHKVISTRRRTLLSTEDILEELAEGRGPFNAAELIVAWVDRIVWRMQDTIEAFDDRVQALEDKMLSGEVGGVRMQTAQLRKQAVSIRRYLAPQREAMNRLVSEDIGWLDEISRLRLREANDRLIRYIEDLDEVRDRAALAQEELFTRLSEQMNKRSYVFTVVATIFLPLGFFTGLMGINVDGMPGVENDAAFWIVVAICLGLSILLAALFRFKRWL